VMWNTRVQDSSREEASHRTIMARTLTKCPCANETSQSRHSVACQLLAPVVTGLIKLSYA
jgi:GTP cyclohydrolase FolE2